MHLHAYTAGLIDGEGSIQLTRHSAKAKFRFPFVTMTSTTYQLCEFLKQTYGGYICKKKTYSKKHKQAWHWNCQSQAAIDMLEKILPYMREPEKIRRASMILEEYPKLTVRNGKYSDTQRELKLQFEHRFMHPSNA